MSNMNEKNGATKGLNPASKSNMPSFATPEVVEAAVWIEADKYVPMKSMPSLVRGEAGDNAATGLKIDSNLERLSAVVVKGGEKEYVLSDSEIFLSGYGCSDFTSRGAGALSIDNAKLTLKNVEIVTRGSGRSATIATEGATLKVYDSKIASYGGSLPPGYKPVIGPGMMEPPWPLGLSGNCRTHLSMDHSQTYFYNCEVFAQAWAALSTDSSGGFLYLEANDCRITVAGNGYGTYADNGCHNCFNNCDFNVGNVLAIQDGNSSVTLNNTDAVCGKNCFMLHGGLMDYIDTGIIEIHGGRLEANEAIFLAKSTNVDIYVKGTTLLPKSGVILKSVVTDDEYYAKVRTKGPECYGLQITFENMEVNGSILHEDTERKMNISLVDTTLRGSITGGANIAFFSNSRWYAAADSQVVLAGPIDITSIDAAAGVTITASAGKDCSLSGEYQLAGGGKMLVK